jgi:hypothetical protein
MHQQALGIDHKDLTQKSQYKSFLVTFNPEDFGGETLVKPTEADKRNFMIFYEELEIMTNSDLMVPELAYYEFGYDAVNFWDKEEEAKMHRGEDEALTLFAEFVNKSRQFLEEDKQHFRQKVLKIRYYDSCHGA